MKVLVSMVLVLALASVASAAYTPALGWEVPGAVYNAAESRYEVQEGASEGVNLVAGFEGTPAVLPWDPRLPDPGVIYTEADVPWATTGLAIGVVQVVNGAVTKVSSSPDIAGTLHPGLLHHMLGSNEGEWLDGSINDFQILDVLGGVDIDNPDGAPFSETAYSFTVVTGAADTTLEITDWLIAASYNPFGARPMQSAATWFRDGVPNPAYDPVGYPKEIWDPDCPPFGCMVPNPDYDPDDPRAIMWGIEPAEGDFPLPFIQPGGPIPNPVPGELSVSLYIVPEPATIALLALGSLALYRRRSS